LKKSRLTERMPNGDDRTLIYLFPIDDGSIWMGIEIAGEDSGNVTQLFSSPDEMTDAILDHRFSDCIQSSLKLLIGSVH
jgi:hypothetical protein